MVTHGRETLLLAFKKSTVNCWRWSKRRTPGSTVLVLFQRGESEAGKKS